MAGKKILMLTGEFSEEYEIFVFEQTMHAVGHTVHVVKTSALAWETRLAPIPVTEVEPAMRALEADGLLTLDARRVSATSRGRLLLRIIAMCFDTYLPQTEAAPRYSRVI